MKTRRHFMRLTLASSLSAMLLSACGFKLRQSPTFEFKTLWIGGAPRIRGFVLQLLSDLRSNVVVVSNPDEAEVLLFIDDERSTEVIVGETLSGQVREKQLRMSITFKMWFQGEDPEKTQSKIEQFRESSYSETQALAKSEEEELLFQDMRKSIANQLVWRLAALKRKNKAA